MCRGERSGYLIDEIAICPVTFTGLNRAEGPALSDRVIILCPTHVVNDHIGIMDGCIIVIFPSLYTTNCFAEGAYTALVLVSSTRTNMIRKVFSSLGLSIVKPFCSLRGCDAATCCGGCSKTETSRCSCALSHTGTPLLNPAHSRSRSRYTGSGPEKHPERVLRSQQASRSQPRSQEKVSVSGVAGMNVCIPRK